MRHSKRHAENHSESRIEAMRCHQQRADSAAAGRSAGPSSLGAWQAKGSHATVTVHPCRGAALLALLEASLWKAHNVVGAGRSKTSRATAVYKDCAREPPYLSRHRGIRQQPTTPCLLKLKTKRQTRACCGTLSALTDFTLGSGRLLAGHTLR